MAERVKNAKMKISNTYSTLYTCPPANSAMVVSLIIANIDGTNNADLSVKWVDASDYINTELCKTVVVPYDSSLILLDKSSPLVLEENDYLQVLASANDSLTVTASIIELS